MKYKKSFIFICLIICLFSIASIAAGDVNDNAIASENQDSVDANVATAEADNEKIESEVSSSSNEDVLSEKDNGTFTALQKKIDNAASGSTITLENDYIYDEGFDTKGIIINKSITIDGKGHTLDGNKQSRIFNVESSYVTVKNIAFVNGEYFNDGGAIYWTGGNGVVSACNFSNNDAGLYHGGAIYWTGENAVVSACNFVNNRAGQIGGALCWHYKYDGVVSDCIFESNNAMYGGAIYEAYAINCTFRNNYASYDGGAMDGSYSSATNCKFYQNSASKEGGAMSGSSDSSAEDCIFIGNRANVGGAMSGGSAVNCDFNSNYASESGGAISGGHAVKCRFNLNNAGNSGGAMGGGFAEDCIFTNNSANDGGAVFSVNSFENCIFTGNHAQMGGAVYLCKVINCQFTDNFATKYGGAVMSGEMAKCTFKNNVAGISGNDVYDVEIIKLDTKISASPVTTVYNGGKYITITLKDDYGDVSDVKLDVRFSNGKSYNPTVTNGQAKVSTNGLPPKAYTATITFNGNIYYAKSTTSVKVTVKKATPNLTAKAATFKKSVKTKKYTVTLKTNQNKVMKNTKITLKVDGKTYSAKTNTKGVATFKLTTLTKKGTFTATVKYAGSKYYNAKTVKPKITVK